MSFSPFIKSKLPISPSSKVYIPKPSIDPTNKYCIIISTDCYGDNETTPGIYRCDIINNASQIIYKYPPHFFKPNRHDQFINPSNNTLVLYGGDITTFGVFDLNNNKMELNDPNILCKCGTAKHTFVPSPINTIYILDKYCNHYQFSIINKQTIRIETPELDAHNITHPKLLYIKSNTNYNDPKLFVFGSDNSNKIFEYNNNDNKWNINTLQMPYSEVFTDYDIVNPVENILMVFYFKKKGEIFILDLLNLKWFKSSYVIPYEFIINQSNGYVFKMGNNVHIINFQKNIHFKSKIKDIIPKEIIVTHQTYFKKLIMGYVRHNTKQVSLITIDLQTMILNYFELFE